MHHRRFKSATQPFAVSCYLQLRRGRLAAECMSATGPATTTWAAVSVCDLRRAAWAFGIEGLMVALLSYHTFQTDCKVQRGGSGKGGCYASVMKWKGDRFRPARWRPRAEAEKWHQAICGLRIPGRGRAMRPRCDVPPSAECSHEARGLAGLGRAHSHFRLLKYATIDIPTVNMTTQTTK